MPNVIVKSCYIKSSAHFINYLEYAGEKLEAQTLVLNDGSKIDVDPDELIDVSQIENLRYVQLELKDGTVRRFGAEKYKEYILEKTEEYDEIDIVSVSDNPDNKSLRIIPPEKYLEYIAFRPGAEKNPNCSHGLFGINGAVNMDAVKESVLENEKSYKWSHIISLTREGAEETGFDNRQAWENLIKAKAYDIGNLYNIPPEHLEIMAAYHDKSYHPHCHLYFYSNANTTAEGCAGFADGDLAKKSRKLRSIFNNEIFKEQTQHLLEEKNELRKEISEEMKRFIQEVGKANYTPDTEIVAAFTDISETLSDYSGRPFYEYLSPDCKQKVDNFLRIVVSSDSNLNQIYNKILENQHSVLSMYNENDKTNALINDFEKRFFHPKSKRDIRTLHNIIIKQAMICNQKLFAPQPDGVVRKDEFSSFSNDNISAESFFDENEPLLGEDMQNTSDEIDIYPEQTSYNDTYTSNSAYEADEHIRSNGNSGLWTKKYMQARFLLYGDKNTSPDLPSAYKAMLKESDNGNVLAMHDLGKMLLNGLGCEKNIETAQDIFAKALNKFKKLNNSKENPYLQYRIGKMYEFGYGTEENASEAAKWYNRAVFFTEKPSPFAAYSLGNLYFTGKGVQQDYEMAFDCFEISATAKMHPSAYAMYKLGEMYANGIGTEADIKQATAWYKQAYLGFLAIEENNNDDYILYKLGNMNYKGLGTEQNFKLAEEYYLRASELENINAYYGLGQLYSNKKFKGYDIKKALDYYNLTIKSNSDDDTKGSLTQYAQYALGKLYLQNDEIIDLEKAVEYFEASAEQNNQFAQYQLGKIYRDNKEMQNTDKAIAYFTKSAEQSNQYAQYALGKLFLEDGKHKNVSEAVHYLKKASAQNNCFASYLLGNIYSQGIDINADATAAQQYYSKAYKGFKNLIEDDSNNDTVLYRMGNMCLNGLGVKKDINQAILYFSNAAKLKNPYAAYTLGNLYSNDKIIKSDKEAAEKYYKQAYEGFIKIAQDTDIETGDAILYNLGKMNLQGLGTAENLNKAIEFFTASAELENQFAQYDLGKIYLQNDNIKDLNKAIKYLKASAEQGNQHAQYVLGKLFLENKEIAKDVNRAIEFLTASANQKNEYARYTLGRLYLEEKSVRNIEQGITLLDESAKQGNIYAQYFLGKAYFDGIGVDEDIKKALEYYQKYAEEGNQFSQYALGKIYYYGCSDENGFEVKKDIEKAVSYFKASAKQGNKYAKIKLEYISEQYSKADKYFFTYGTSLLISRLAYAMSSLILQKAHNQEDERNRKHQKRQPKFASKNHQISKAHLKPQSPIQY